MDNKINSNKTTTNWKNAEEKAYNESILKKNHRRHDKKLYASELIINRKENNCAQVNIRWVKKSRYLESGGLVYCHQKKL